MQASNTIRLAKSYLEGAIESPPPSKSLTHRAIFMAALGRGTSIVSNILDSRDTQASRLAAECIGAKVEKSGNELTITGNGKLEITDGCFYAANSGTTLRIFTMLAALTENETAINGDGSLNKRPVGALAKMLTKHGVEVKTAIMERKLNWLDSEFVSVPPITVKGPILGNSFTIDASQSSQFASAILLAMPMMEEGGELKITGKAVSKPYIDSTVSMMKKFGVEFEVIEPYLKYSVSGTGYKPANLTIPVDYSAIALLATAGALLGRNDGILINVGRKELVQGDEAYLGMLNKLGVKTEINGDKLRIIPAAKMSGGSFDLSDTPDLLPPLAIAALKCSEKVEIHNVAHARLKETDRIKVLAAQIRKFGMSVEEKTDGMILERKGELHGAAFEAHDDHRLFMALAIGGMYVGNSTVDSANSVNVSYPNFIADVQGIGGQIMPVMRY